MVFHPIRKGPAHHDLLPIRLNFLQFHARMSLQFTLGARQCDAEGGQDVVRRRVA